ASGIRAMRRTLTFPATGKWTVDLCLTLDETAQTIANFRRRLAEGGAAFLAVAALAGWLLTRQALRPVAASLESARQLNPNDLSARLPRPPAPRRPGPAATTNRWPATTNPLLGRLPRYQEKLTRSPADASHELRGPLAAMRAAVEVALQQRRTAEDYREALESLGEQCQHL